MIIAALYAIFQLTPSSYALALQMVGVTDTGLLFGLPQLVRSDEWALWTLYVQIAVNNDFARIEHISPLRGRSAQFQRAAAVGLGTGLQAADVGVLRDACRRSRSR